MERAVSETVLRKVLLACESGNVENLWSTGRYSVQFHLPDNTVVT